jgi:hypothetical protein
MFIYFLDFISNAIPEFRNSAEIICRKCKLIYWGKTNQIFVAPESNRRRIVGVRVKYIDNSFFRLTAAQAKELSIENRLPRHGYEMRANPEKLASVELLYARPIDGKYVPSERTKASNAKSGWIQRTPLSWHDGAAVKDGWTWALRLDFNQ